MLPAGVMSELVYICSAGYNLLPTGQFIVWVAVAKCSHTLPQVFICWEEGHSLRVWLHMGQDITPLSISRAITKGEGRGGGRGDHPSTFTGNQKENGSTPKVPSCSISVTALSRPSIDFWIAGNNHYTLQRAHFQCNLIYYSQLT